jgi:hypothetical protein
MKMFSYCTTSDFTYGAYANGEECFKSLGTTYSYETYFVFNKETCKWEKVHEDVTQVDGFVVALTCNPSATGEGECSAEDPEPRLCETNCGDSFDGCDCNEFP